MTDIAAEIRDILVFHLGVEEGLLTDDARLADDLGADRLDLVEIAMSCEERFDVDIPNHVAAGLATVGDAVRFVQAQLARSTGAGPARRPVRPRFLFGEALQACARLARRRSADRDVLETRSSSVPAATRAGSRGMAMRAILILAVAGLVALVLQPAGAAAEIRLCRGLAAGQRHAVVALGHVRRRVQGPGHDLLRPGPAHQIAGDPRRQVRRRLAAGQRHAVDALGHVRRRVQGAGHRPTSARAFGSPRWRSREAASRRSGGRAAARSGCAGVCRSTSSRRRTPTYFNQGLRIACWRSRTAASRPSGGRQRRAVGARAACRARLRRAGSDLLRSGPADHVAGDRRRQYAAVWQPGSGAQWWSTAAALVDFKTEDAAYFARGLRIVLHRARRTIRSAPTAIRGRAACPHRSRRATTTPRARTTAARRSPSTSACRRHRDPRRPRRHRRVAAGEPDGDLQPQPADHGPATRRFPTAACRTGATPCGSATPAGSPAGTSISRPTA